VDYLDYVRVLPPRIQPARYHNYNPFNDLSDREFIDRFRFSKQSVYNLIDILGPRLGNPDPRAQHRIPNWKKVLAALRFFADGTFHRETGDLLDCGEGVGNLRYVR
jgi:hypothetical protein